MMATRLRYIILGSLFLAIVAVVLNIVSIARPYWQSGFVSSDIDLHFHSGLWQICYTGKAKISRGCWKTTNKHIAYLDAVRVTVCAAIFFGFTALFLVASALLISMTDDNPMRARLMTFAVGVIFLAAILDAVGVLTYGIKFAESRPATRYLDFAYFLCVASGSLYILVGCLLAYVYRLLRGSYSTI